MSNRDNYVQAALGAPPKSIVSDRTVLLPDVAAPVVTISTVYPMQSYFDSTLLEKAILTQNPADPIVASTKNEIQMNGYGIGLHPSSETPVAVQLKVGNKTDASSPLILKPGQVYFPSGRQKGHAFGGLSYGLPFGWLGGGLATLVVFQTPDADVKWDANTEVIFHSFRAIVMQPSEVTADAPKNWPTRFPWGQALRGSGSIPQKGSPVLSVQPTRTMMVLRNIAELGAPRTMRVVFQGTDDVNRDSNSVVVLTSPLFSEVTWPSFAALGASGNLTAACPALMLGELFSRVAANNGGIRLINSIEEVDTGLDGAYVDIVRYGVL